MVAMILSLNIDFKQFVIALSGYAAMSPL